MALTVNQKSLICTKIWTLTIKDPKRGMGKKEAHSELQKMARSGFDNLDKNVVIITNQHLLNSDRNKDIGGELTGFDWSCQGSYGTGRTLSLSALVFIFWGKLSVSHLFYLIVREP